MLLSEHQHAILAALKQGGLTALQIQRVTGRGPISTGPVLIGLRQAELVVVRGNLYELTSSGREAASQG